MIANWRILHPNDYFRHTYNQTCFTEREIEIAIGLKWLNENCLDVIEIGAVMPYYTDVSHEVIDPYDEKATIMDFMENHDLTLMNVISISTVEHIGMTDYVEQEVVTRHITDEEAAINALKQILNQADNCLVSIPIGYNPCLDKWLKENLEKLNCFGYEKILMRGEGSLWNYYEEVQNIDKQYGSPFPYGNFVLFIEGWKTIKV